MPTKLVAKHIFSTTL